MCTLTIIAERNGGGRVAGARAVFNRDEQRARGRGLPPREVMLGRVRAVMPTDPKSGGSWIGINDRGLAACVLNGNPDVGGAHAERWAGRASRGVIVPRLLECATMEQALELAGEIEAREFPAFCAVCFDTERVCAIVSDGQELRVDEPSVLTRAYMRTSSGLGDALVEGPRRAIFEDLLGGDGADRDRQDRLHAHQWRGREHLSVLMSREDARTVSRTIVELTESRATMRYEALGDDLRVEVGAIARELVIPGTGARA